MVFGAVETVGSHLSVFSSSLFPCFYLIISALLVASGLPAAFFWETVVPLEYALPILVVLSPCVSHFPHLFSPSPPQSAGESKFIVGPNATAPPTRKGPPLSGPCFQAARIKTMSLPKLKFDLQDLLRKEFECLPFPVTQPSLMFSPSSSPRSNETVARMLFLKMQNISLKHPPR